MTAKHPIFRTKYSIFIIALIVPALLFSSCGFPASGVAPTATAVPPTPTVQVALDTPTPIPPSPTPILLADTATAIPPSPTPVVIADTPTPIPPTPTPLPVLTDTLVPQTGNIVFAPGTTAASLKGTVQPGQIITYTAEASIYQPMILHLESPGNTATLGVLDPNGSPLFNPAVKWINWQWRLPESGVYTIQVIGGATTVDYILTVKIAELVSYPAGTHTLSLHGNTYLGYVHSYAIGLSAGDGMTASLNTPSSKAFLDIFGLATGPLLKISQLATTWTGILPKTQEYVIEVIPRGGYLVSYTLTITSP